MRLPPVLLLVLTVACGKPFWHPPLPALSQEPLPLGQAVTWGIYATLLAEEGGSPENHPVRNPVILAESTLASEPGSFESFDYGIGGKAFIGSRWPDSVKVGFSAAFADLWHKARRRHPIDPSVVLGLAVQLGDTGPRACGLGSAPWCQERATHVALSPIGFNGDSTYAVVYRTMWCGPTCGTGVLFMFRRTASTAWTVWDAHLMWIS